MLYAVVVANVIAGVVGVGAVCVVVYAWRSFARTPRA